MKLSGLQRLGLTAGEIKVFAALLENGPQPVTKLMELTGLKKGDCYNKVADLVGKELVEEFEESKKKHYRLTNPQKLEEVATRQYQEAATAKREIDSLLPEILSTYTLAYHQAGIVTFEGKEAMRRILDDSLTSQGPILQYVDLKTVLGLYPKLNAAYARKRQRLGVKKQILLSDNALAREYAAAQDPSVTEVKLLAHDLPRFYSVMQIYNDKISYLTLKPAGMIGMIIEDPYLAKMHRALFQMNWAAAHTPLELSESRQSDEDQTAG